jgi:hypothetical protein
MATTLKKQFLDYAGLQQFWGIIDHKFANKVDAVKVDSFNFDTTETSVTLTYTDCNDATTGSAAAKTYDIALPMAKSSITAGEGEDPHAGLMSAADKYAIDTIEDKINMAAPFHGLQIDGKEVNLGDDRRANIGLKFEQEGSVSDGTRKAYIDLVDLEYPEGQSWSESTKEAYEANQSNAAYYAWQDGATIKYYKWSKDNEAGPKNNLGAPLMSKPISRIDVSELVKAGLLADADVVLQGSGENAAMYLKLTFITNGDGNETKDVLINITDLVDIYNEGEGIEIEQGALSADEGDENTSGMGTGSARTSTIKLRVANEEGKNELGGIRVGYTSDAVKQLYKVELDQTGNAFVAVPWENVTVNVTTSDANAAGEKYLVVTPTIDTTTVDANGIPQHSYSFNVEVGTGVKNAENLAGTSVQSVGVGAVSEETGAAGVSKDAYIKVSTEQMTRTSGDKTINAGTKIVTELTDSAKASLGLADTSVQGVTTATTERSSVVAGHEYVPAGNDLVVSLVKSDGNTEYDGTKGGKTIKVALGDKTIASLTNADTAIQDVSIMGTVLNKTNNTYTRENAELALGLGSASNVNVVEAIPTVGTGENGALVDADFKSEVADKDVAGTKEARYTVATTKAVKTYVDDEIGKLNQIATDYVDARIASLDTHDAGEITPENGYKPHVTNDSVEAAYDYTNGKYAGEEGYSATSKTILTQIGQTDGILDTAKTKTSAIGIQDIYDFAPLSLTDITTICGTAVGSNVAPKA